MTEIKPCPFCGRQPHWGDGGSLECDCGVKMEAWMFVSTPIEAWGKFPMSSAESPEDTASRTIERWNRRVNTND